ncbi:ParB N-terminal domain-containing protein [Bosea sp. Root483D1]|uniref:ParB N-terminal domain-containing protein n=1 Tax=Bosea sp. Root483D1 TaxID=1736544 RepID=UPI00138F43B9|nr:ParB N-terminal domain-containing protein [Bosea sp. Root483D1]
MLMPSPENVRQAGRKDGIDQLAVSIRAHGLRQGLNVKFNAEGHYKVVAGERRRPALKQLAKVKHLPKDFRCRAGCCRKARTPPKSG